MSGCSVCRTLSFVLGSVGLALVFSAIVLGAPSFAVAGGGGYADECTTCDATRCVPSGYMCPEGTCLNCPATCSCKQASSQSCKCK